MKYIVIVQIDEDGDMTGEYTGVEHDNREDARKEFLRAKDDVRVFSAWMRKDSMIKSINKLFSRIFEIGADPGDAGTDFDDVLGF